MKNYKEIKQALEKEGLIITPRLQQLTYELIKLVESDQIESFSFQEKQDKSSLKGDNPLLVRVSIKGENHHVVVGLFEDLKDHHKAQDMLSDKAYTKLNDINAYLSFANEHLKSFLPQMNAPTYYSINAVNRLGAFKKDPVAHLLPDFMQEDLAPLKAIKPKP